MKSWDETYQSGLQFNNVTFPEQFLVKIFFDPVFREKFDKLQQEQRDLEESYQQSKRNKKEREDMEDNEEYLKELKDKL